MYGLPAANELTFSTFVASRNEGMSSVLVIFSIFSIFSESRNFLVREFPKTKLPSWKIPNYRVVVDCVGIESLKLTTVWDAPSGRSFEIELGLWLLERTLSR